MPPTRVYLTGFMGSGKSTAGPLVAAELGYAFVDLDERIVEKAGRTIPQLFAEQGEAVFRRIEAAALAETTQQEGVVVALGGGALTFEANLNLARAKGLVVYLRVPVEELTARLMQKGAERPLLAGGSGPLTAEEAQRRIEDLMARREPFYARAHVTIDAGGQDVPGTVEAVLRSVRGLGGS